MCHPDQVSFPVGADRPAEPVTIAVGADRSLPCLLHRGDGDGDGDGEAMPIMLLTDVYGPTAFYAGLARDLADHGWRTLVPDYLRAAGTLVDGTRDEALARGRRLDQGAGLDDLSVAVDWLAGQAGSDRVGILGFCLGGTLALDLAARRPDLAVVTYYAFPEGFAGRNPVPAPIDVAGEIHGPVLAFWGAEDYMDAAGVRRFCDLLAARETDFAYEIYPGVGHSFLAGLADDEPTAVSSWRRTRAFFAGQHDRAAAGAR